MRVSAKKNAELLKQYPFLAHLVRLPFEPLASDSPNPTKVDDLVVTFEKADGDLLYRKADNIGLIDTGCMLAAKGRHKGMAGKRGEYLFALDEDGVVLKRLDWPKGRDEERVTKPPYAFAVLWGIQEGEVLSQPHYDRTKYLVWVTVKAWHERTRDSSQPFGQLQSREMCITVYGEPSQGFQKLQDEANLYDNLYLDSHTLMTAALDHNYDINVISGHLGELCNFFQREVYFAGMKDIVDAGPFRGASGQLGPVKVLAAEMCGYDRVMLENSICWVSFQLRPGAKSMYMLGCGGTLPQLRELTLSAIEGWKSGGKEKFTSDKNVSVM